MAFRTFQIDESNPMGKKIIELLQSIGLDNDWIEEKGTTPSFLEDNVGQDYGVMQVAQSRKRPVRKNNTLLLHEFDQAVKELKLIRAGYIEKQSLQSLIDELERGNH
ncbi:MAG TPA: hypothetical protein PKV50_02155 [Prolixibacteraceae bacterium]|nr:hypothetical protein [Prolixibacteraceae bacterium]